MLSDRLLVNMLKNNVLVTFEVFLYPFLILSALYFL